MLTPAPAPLQGLAQPFAAVGQVQAHGRTGRVGVLAGDGSVDVLVLAAQAIQMSGSR